MITAIVDHTSMATHMTTGVNGGTWVHLARSADYLWCALNAVRSSERDAKLFINIPNARGHSPFDIHWNNYALRDIIEDFGGRSVLPMPTAHGKGKKGKGKGKGTRDGIGPEHQWNSQFHGQV